MGGGGGGTFITPATLCIAAHNNLHLSQWSPLHLPSVHFNHQRRVQVGSEATLPQRLTLSTRTKTLLSASLTSGKQALCEALATP